MREDPSFLAMRIPVDVEISLGFISLNIINALYDVPPILDMCNLSPSSEAHTKKKQKMEESYAV